MAQTYAAIKPRETRYRRQQQVFRSHFRDTMTAFAGSRHCDKGAAIAALTSNNLRSKDSTEEELYRLLACYTLLLKSEAGHRVTDASEIITKAWHEYYLRELSIWSIFYR